MPEDSHGPREVGRLNAFTDGVMVVAMTDRDINGLGQESE
jgi:hypothetical protein